ncbi:MAG: hypothetical protein KDC98_25775 [Planctomycetes bacterium]|nr:hypothetical protein [Planctomycetota bacterium]
MARPALAVRLIANADALLRGEGPYAAGRGVVPWPKLLALVAVGGFAYGAVMGSYGVRALQAFYSASKVPLLLLFATIVCLPNFYVVNVLLGLRDDFSAACRGIFAAQATLAVTLATLAPITIVVYLSIDGYDGAIVCNGVMFLVATITAQIALGRHYRALIATNPRHRLGRAAWMVLYVFVAIQLAWVLRPFVGSPNMATHFFREDAWSNAYIEVFLAVARVFGA